MSAANSAGALTVGVPREIKHEEHRVAITPDGVREVLHTGATVLIEAGAGVDGSVGTRRQKDAKSGKPSLSTGSSAAHGVPHARAFDACSVSAKPMDGSAKKR